MKSPKNMNPLGSKLDSFTLDTFLKQLHQTLALLEQSKAVSLNKTKVSISISKYLKLKLGDTFRFFYLPQRKTSSASDKSYLQYYSVNTYQ